MSDYESHAGKLKKVNQYGEDLNVCFRRILNKNNIEIDSEDSLEEQVMSEFHQKYIVSGNDLYEIIEHEELDHSDSFAKLSKNEDGTISFFSTFYNGGTCLGEMLEDELKNLK